VARHKDALWVEPRYQCGAPVCKTDCDANILSIHKKKRKEKKIGQIKKSQNTLPLY
jgi:hypothetical protein